MLEHLRGLSVQNGEIQKYAESAMVEVDIYYYGKNSLKKVLVIKVWRRTII